LIDDGIYHQGRFLEFFFTQQAIALGLIEDRHIISKADAKLAYSFLDKIFQLDASYHFRLHVDPVMYPDYYVKIRYPVDLSTIRDRVQEYETLDAFEKDFNLLISNCNIFNAKGSPGLF
jgi:hypothetical protein